MSARFDNFEAACDFARAEVAKHGRLSAGCMVETDFAHFSTSRLTTGRSMEGSAFTLTVHASSKGGFLVG